MGAMPWLYDLPKSALSWTLLAITAVLFSIIFGVPLVDVETNEDNVPKVMRMYMEEIEKRGLDTNKIYSVS